MKDDIDQLFFALVRRHNGFYLFNNVKNQQLLNCNSDIDADMQLDAGEEEDLMDNFFEEFHVKRGSFKIQTYYPDAPFS